MLALTVKQPFAWATSIGVKPVENRGWRPRPGLIGARVAIHAGKAWDDAGFADAMVASGRWEWAVADVRGAVVAVATLREVVVAHPSPFFHGPFGFVWSDVVKLLDPVPCRGALSFWRLPPKAEAAVEAQLRG